jgi:RNase P/RNase MRP subunit p29
MAQTNLMKALREAERIAERELIGIRAAIVAVSDGTAGSVSGRARDEKSRSRNVKAAAMTHKVSNMSRAARKAASVRMKKYWAMRRKAAKR